MKNTKCEILPTYAGAVYIKAKVFNLKFHRSFPL